MKQSKMKPEAMNIIKMISKPQNQRMPFEGIQLTKFVQRIPFFHRFFPFQAQTFVTFCLSAQLIQYQPGQSLFEHEHSPNLIYIVIDGSVQLQSLQNGVTRIVNAYDVIGNVEVVFELEKRGQATRTLTKVFCMVLKAEGFKTVWSKQEEISKAYHYLKINKYFQDLSVYDKQSLSLLMVHEKFQPGEILSHEGRVNEKVFFVIYGKMEVTKKINIHNIQRESIIDSVEEMDSYGEYEALSKQTSQTSLKAITSGTYYSINVEEVRGKSHPVLKSFEENGLPYPSKEELEFRFSVQASVGKYQQKIKRSLPAQVRK